MALTKVTGGTISTTSDYQINNLVAVAGTFTGNLNVEGVLTYEDVTNIDAVGLITARKGIHLGAGATVGHLSTVGVSTITSLTVNGTLTAGGDVSIADKIVHTGDTNTAIRFPAADQISFETAGTERIRIHENGTISTNVDNDTYEFTIQGKTGGSPTLWLRDGTTSGTPRVIFGDTNAAAVGAIAYANNGDYMQFKTGGNELVRFTNNSGSAGKVGIGSEIPVSKFDVADGTTGISFDRTNNTPEIHFRSNNVDECGEIRLGESSGGGVMDLRTKTTGGTLTTRLSLHTNGKAAIGDHTPGSHLDIRNSGQVDVLIGSTNAGGVYLMLDGDSNGDGVGADYAYLAHDTGGDLQIGADNPSGNAEIIFKAGNNVEKLRIASDGVVWAKDGKIRLGTTSGTDSYIYSSNAAGIIYQADDNGHKFQTYSGSWQTRLTITDAGKVTIGDAATHTYSAHSEGDDLVVGGSGWRGMTIYGEGGGGVIQFADDGSNRAGQLMYNHGDNSMLFRTNGNTTRFKIGSDGTSTATGTSDGVLQLDTSDSRGAFIRFGQGGSYHHMIGCADGLVAGPDKEDLGLRAADNMVFCTNGATERLRITSGGQVNIGGNYTQTFNALDVTGNIKASARFNANDAVFIWQQNRMSLGNSFIIESQQNTPFAILTQAVVQPIVFGTNSTERLRIGSDGILTVSSETVIINRNAGDPYLTFQTSGTSNAVIYGGASTGLRGFTKPSGGSLTERVRIHSDGEVECKGGAAGQNALLVSGNYSSGNNVDIQTWQRIGGAVQAKMGYKDADTSMFFGTDTAHPLAIMTGGTEKLRIRSDGKISCGTAINNSNTYEFSLTGADGTGGFYAHGRNHYLSNRSNAYASLTLKKSNADSDGVDYLQLRDSANNVKLVVSGDGSLNILDSIVHEGDTDTKIRFPAANTVTIDVGGTTRLNANSTQLEISGNIQHNGCRQYQTNSTSSWTTIGTFSTATAGFSMECAGMENSYTTLHRVTGSAYWNQCYYTADFGGDSQHAHSSDLMFRVTNTGGTRTLEFKAIQYTTTRILTIISLWLKNGYFTWS